MRKIIFFNLILFFQFLNLSATDPKLNEIINGLNSPWSITFIKKNQLLITEKSGNLILADLKNQKLKKINHNLKVLVDGQGGLLDILYEDNVDTNQIITSFLDAKTTPECFLLDNDLNILYQGLIDNWIKELGRKGQNIDAEYLNEAIMAYLLNDTIIIQNTNAIGCIIERFK